MAFDPFILQHTVNPEAVQPRFLNDDNRGSPGSGTLGQLSDYATLALGSAFAMFLYPHTMTGVLSANSRDAIRRNAAYLPAYSFLLGLLALTGFMALVTGVDKPPEFTTQFAHYGSNFAVPALVLHTFPD